MTGTDLRRFLFVAAAVTLGGAAVALVGLSPLASASSRPRLSEAQSGRVNPDLRTYSACPASDRRQLKSTAAGSNTKLVPRVPRQVLLCRYSGLNPILSRAFRLLAQRLINDRQTVARLTAEFNALKRVPSGAQACPADSGVEIIAIFRYLPTPRADDPVTLDPDGCTGVTNGRLTRAARFAPGPALIGQLEALTETRLPPHATAPGAPVRTTHSRPGH
jgi:hypothetical protein